MWHVVGSVDSCFYFSCMSMHEPEYFLRFVFFFFGSVVCTQCNIVVRARRLAGLHLGP